MGKEGVIADSCKENFRLILSVIPSDKWKLKSLDIRSAILQGQPISRNVFLRPPKETGTSKL